MEKDEHIIYEDKILAAIIEDYMYLVDWSEGEGILYRVKRGTKEKEVVSRGCDEFLAYKEGWIYFAHLKDCKDIHGRLDIYKCRIDGEEQERVAEEIRCENWDWSKNRIVFTTREDNKTYRYDLRNEAKEYIGIDIELTNQFDESMIFRSSRTDQYYILRNNETKLKKLHWGDIIIVTEKDGSIYYFDEPDYYSEDQEEASILSFYKYNLEKEREETIGKDIDCSLEEYLLIE